VSIWVQSHCDYDFIVAWAFPPSWCSLCCPVLSLSNPCSHWVYLAVNPLEPNGQLVFCYSSCGHESLDPDVLSKKVKIKCLLCGSTCEVKVTEKDSQTPLSRKDMIKVQFPQTWAMTSWKLPQAPQDPGTDEELTSPPKEHMKQPKNNSSWGKHGRGRVQVQRPEVNSKPNPLPLLTAMPPCSSTQGVVHQCHQIKWWRLIDNSFTPS